MDTIFAPATSAGKAGVAVVRISGPDAFRAASCLCGNLPSNARALRKLGWRVLTVWECALRTQAKRERAIAGLVRKIAG